MALTIEEPTLERPGGRTGDGAGDFVLTGSAADAYVARLVGAIDAARLNAFFPPAGAMRNHLSFLGRSGSAGVYDDLALSPLTGLPTAREILRVKIDRDLGADFLLEAARHPIPAADTPMARRIAYYSALVKHEVMPMSRMKVELRQQLPSQGRATFRIVFDRFDLSSGVFARYTILLAQRDAFWRQPHVIVNDEDLAAPTEGFRRIVSRFASHEAEVAFVLLSKLDTIDVEDVRRCRLGPLLMPGVDVGDAIDALLDPRRTPEAAATPPWILCFPEDRAGIEVAAHAAGDPLAPLYREAVSAEARALVDAKADELGYRVAKSRKFVCPEPLRPRLSSVCRELGMPSIVRGVS